MKVPLLKSVFLNRSPRPERKAYNRVLLLGGDGTGSRLARRLPAEGFEVVALGYGEGSEVESAIPVEPGTVLEQVHGFVGGFEATLRSGEAKSIERFGFIVAAQPFDIEPKFRDHGLAPGKRVVSLSDLERLLNEENGLPEPRGDWFHAVFLCGLEGETKPDLFARVFDAVDKLREKITSQCYVFTRHVKVAGAGLERHYRQIRQEGTLFFRFEGPSPHFQEAEDGLTILFVDPVLGQEMELVPDLIVVDEHQRPPSSLKPVLDGIPSSCVSAPFLQSESTRFPGVRTPKAGIFAVGASRGDMSLEGSAYDEDALVLAIKTAALQEAPEDLPGPPVIDPAKCTICLTCIRLCPHGAISFHNRAEADPASCMRCGICAVECPMEAIALAPPDGDPDLPEKISRSVTQGGRDKKITAFLCSRSGLHAMESVSPERCKNISPIVVPCAGTLDPVHIISAFREGAEGVLITGCHTGNCASIYGNVLASERVFRTGKILQESGIDPGRLLFRNLASNTPGDFVRAVSELEALI
ncbi:hydrogenase iron-sulfur subunit [Thermodesulfobacteriota bacterium]